MVNQDYSIFFQEALKLLKEDFHSQNKDQEFSLWFEKITYIKAAEKAIFLSAPSGFVRDQLYSRNYVDLLQKKLQDLLGHDIEIEFQIHNRESAKENNKPEKNNEQMPSAAQKKPAAPKEKHPTLKAEFSFDSFIPGELNRFPYNAALAVSKNPGKTYNPLLFYGGVGLGKTHLMQAIGNAIYQTRGGKIIYTSAENFTNEFTDSLRTKKETEFAKKFRSADVLLLDDIQFLQGKRAVQEQIFYAFEALYNYQKQLVFVSDRHISELREMNDRLVSRFDSGISLDIRFPNYETRIAIIEKKLELSGNTLPKDVIELMAARVETNIRELESCLKTLFSYADIIQKDITLEIAEEQLKDKFKSPFMDTATIENIQKAVANYYNISFSDIKGKKRNKSIITPRHIAMYITYKLTELSFTEIGYEFGGKDHTTIMHACNKIKDALHHDSSLDSTIQILERMIKEKKY